MRSHALIFLLLTMNLPGFAGRIDSLTLTSDSLRTGTPAFSLKTKKGGQYVLPIVLIGYGFTSLNRGVTRRLDKHIRHELLEEYPYFSTRIDNKLQYAPVAAVYALNMMGIKSKNSLSDRTKLCFMSNAIMGITVNILKAQTGKLRPSGSDQRSFPSGHTATAFVAAEFMRQELGDASPWYGYMGYAMAGATGGLRMMNDKHWLSDVLAGAGIGILSTKFTYFTYPWIKKKMIGKRNLDFMAMPIKQDRKLGLSFVAPL